MTIFKVVVLFWYYKKENLFQNSLIHFWLITFTLKSELSHFWRVCSNPRKQLWKHCVMYVLLFYSYNSELETAWISKLDLLLCLLFRCIVLYWLNGIDAYLGQLLLIYNKMLFLQLLVCTVAVHMYVFSIPMCVLVSYHLGNHT